MKRQDLYPDLQPFSFSAVSQMSDQTDFLEALDQRLQRLVSSPADPAQLIKSEEEEVIDISLGKYICAECNWTTSKAQALSAHYLRAHLSFSCPNAGCVAFFLNEAQLELHRKQAHEFKCMYTNCQKTFETKEALDSHLQQHHETSVKPQSYPCPDSGCSLVFADFALLFQHYDGRHPPSIMTRGSKKRFKCPFCQKAYSQERHISAHIKKDHLPNRWAVTGKGSHETQEALFQQSHESMERRVSAASFGASEKVGEARAHGDGEPDEEYSTTVSNGTIYIDDTPIVATPNLELPQTHVRNEKMAIGFILATPSTDADIANSEQSKAVSASLDNDPLTDEDDYPESYALDDSERPQPTNRSNRRVVTDQLTNIHLGRRIFRWILSLLHMDRFMGVSELTDLWTTFLTTDQRTLILDQLHDINPREEDETKILSILHGTVLNELIHSWARFKLLASNQVPLRLARQARSAKGFTYVVLQYCEMLEALINQGRPAAYASGVQFPDLLRPIPPSNFPIEAPFGDMLAALADRVKCRLVHPEWVVFTNVMVLREMEMYLGELKIMVKALFFPRPDGMEDWYERLGIE